MKDNFDEMNKSEDVNNFVDLDNLFKNISIKDYPFDEEKTLNFLNKKYSSKFYKPSNKGLIMNILIFTGIVSVLSLFWSNYNDEGVITLFNKADSTQNVITLTGFTVKDSTNINKQDTNTKQDEIIVLSGEVKEENDSIRKASIDFLNKDIDSLTIIMDANNNQILINTENNKKGYFLKPAVKHYFTNTSLKYLELSKLEFNNIIPNTFIFEFLTNLYKDVLIETEEQFKSYNVKELGYSLNDIPLYISEKYVIQNADTAIQMYGWIVQKSTHSKVPNYDKCKFLSFGLVNQNNNMYMWSDGTLLQAKYSTNKKFNEFYNLYENRYNPMDNNDKKTFKMHADNKLAMQELENLFYEDVIPVKVPLFDGRSVMFFFKPTEEFIEKLPERYKESIKNELEAKRLLEQNQPFSCETKNFTTDIFALCNDTDAIQNAKLFPNPGGSDLKLSMKVLDNRKTKIELCDFSGGLLKELMNIDLVKGEKVIDLDINKIPMGLYFIRLSTDKGDVLNLRYIKDK